VWPLASVHVLDETGEELRQLIAQRVVADCAGFVEDLMRA
jgi:hypothetical protein